MTKPVSQSRDLVVVPAEPAPVAVSYQDQALLPAIQLKAMVERARLFTEFQREVLVDGSDYGKIPGTEKKTLLKPGAEKLCTFFGLRRVPEIIEKVEDWTGDEHGGEPFFYYLYRFHLYRGDTLVASADGSCNSWEKKYRWRKQERLCPLCGKAAIRKSNKEPGYFCWRKLEGCGANFGPGDERIESQTEGRVANADVYDLVNTVQKIAMKRSMIAAVLLATNASEAFTQDVEDFHDDHGGPSYDERPDPFPQGGQQQRQPMPGGARSAHGVGEQKGKQLADLLKAAGRTPEGLMAWLKLPPQTPLASLTQKQFDAAIKALSTPARPPADATPSPTVSPEVQGQLEEYAQSSIECSEDIQRTLDENGLDDLAKLPQILGEALCRKYADWAKTEPAGL